MESGDCSGPLDEAEPCGDTNCPETACEWGPWEDWACDVTGPPSEKCRAACSAECNGVEKVSRSPGPWSKVDPCVGPVSRQRGPSLNSRRMLWDNRDRMDEHKARLRWTHRTEYGQRYRWRRIYYAVLPGFAAVDDPVDEHINLMPTTSSPGSASGHTPRGGVQESACEATLDA